ncbi:ester cyclase [Rhizobium alvei]|uniref:Ester cyclase n=1 Tax=Rhizobium alvei TaxID=1132659 RepID=A0ABT8YQB0_9HYPH|nr:ester cyclase [Rhizobium alvei]MDO6965892.1 ester cyclase [Rhizobium alvei]
MSNLTRRATLTFAAVTTAISLFAGSAFAETDYKTKIQLFYDTFRKNDPAILDQIIAPDWVRVPTTPDVEPGREGFKKIVPGFAKVFTDAKLIAEDTIQEGNKVVVRSTYSATQAAPFMGFPSKGRSFTIMTIDIHEFNDEGLVQTTWHLEDWTGALFQLGAFDR